MALANHLGLTDKVVSERHYYASKTKQTAGESAKLITKSVGIKISAKDLKSLYKLRYGCNMEWHHSGFFNGTSGQTMGRTYFISPESTKDIIDNFETLYHLFEEQKRNDEEIVYAFYWEWVNKGSVRHPRWGKELKTYYGMKSQLPKNSTICDKRIYMAAKNDEGRIYKGWDKPELSDFNQCIVHNNILE